MKQLFFFSLLMLSALGLAAQQEFSYSYDESGNRILRQIIYLRTTPIDFIEADKGGLIQSQNQESLAVTTSMENGNVAIYPNPTKGVLRVEFQEWQGELEGKLILIGASGQILHSSNALSLANTIDLRKEASGTYYLKIKLKGESREWTIIKK